MYNSKLWNFSIFSYGKKNMLMDVTLKTLLSQRVGDDSKSIAMHTRRLQVNFRSVVSLPEYVTMSLKNSCPRGWEGTARACLPPERLQFTRMEVSLMSSCLTYIARMGSVTDEGLSQVVLPDIAGWEAATRMSHVSCLLSDVGVTGIKRLWWWMNDDAPVILL